MSKLDTILNVDQSIRLRGLGKLSEAQLKVALSSNQQLVSLKNKLGNEMGALQKSIAAQNKIQQQNLLLQQQQLEIQIRELEFKEIQKFHKERIVKCKEFLKDFSSLTDPYVQKAFVNDLFEQIEIFIDNSRQELSEIPDKEYCVAVKKQLVDIKSKFQSDVEVNEIEKLLEYRSKLLQLEKEKEEKQDDAEFTLDSIMEQDKKAEQDFIKKQKDEEKSLSSMNGCLGILSICSIIMIISIIGQLVKGLISATRKQVYIGLPFFTLIIILFIYRIIRYKRFKKIPIKQYKSDWNALFPEEKQNYESMRVQVKAIADEISKIRSIYKSLYSDMIYKHPEFLKVDYLLEDYQV